MMVMRARMMTIATLPPMRVVLPRPLWDPLLAAVAWPGGTEDDEVVDWEVEEGCEPEEG